MIRTRFSPSPTGLLHIGNVRSALFSALYAAHGAGIFLLRIEDTDVARSQKHYIDSLQHDLQWLGIHWQEGPNAGGGQGPYFQSERSSIYAKYYDELETMGRAYPCFCSDELLKINRKLQLSRGQAPRYPGTCRHLSKEEIEKRLKAGEKPALRFHVQDDAIIEFTDLVKGPQRFLSHDIGDFIIRRADGGSSFMFCNAIDDSLMGVTHVIRGEDHLTNTPRQLMILQTLNLRAPNYAHLSLVTGSDGAPLSKRHGSSSVYDLREKGFLPLAALNYLSRLGHSYDEKHLMTFAELAKQFIVEKVSRSPARFDEKQLEYWQKEAVMTLDDASFWQWIGEDIKNAIPTDKQNVYLDVMRKNSLFPEECRKWKDIFFNEMMEFSDEKKDILKNAGDSFFSEAILLIEQHHENIKQVIDGLKTTSGLSGKSLFLPLRIALTGEEHGPELIHIAHLLGKKEMLNRFSYAHDIARK